MKEVALRRWHRYVGVPLALFLVVQAGTGLLFSISHLMKPSEHGQSGNSTPSGTTKGLAHAHGPAAKDDHHDQPAGKPAESSSEWILDALHHGGGPAGDVYRALLGVAMILQTILGVVIILRIRGRKSG